MASNSGSNKYTYFSDSDESSDNDFLAFEDTPEPAPIAVPKASSPRPKPAKGTDTTHSQVIALEAKIKILERKTANVEILEEENSTLCNRIEQLSAMNKQLTNQIKTSSNSGIPKEELEFRRKKMDALEEERVSLYEEIDELKSQVEQKDLQVRQLERENEALRQNEPNTAEIGEKESVILSQMQQIEEIGSGLAVLKAGQAALEEENKNLKNVIAQSHNSDGVRKLQEKLDLKERIEAELRSELSSLKSRDLFVKTDESSSSIGREQELQDKVDKLERRKKILEQSLCGIKARNDKAMQNVIEAVRAEEKLIHAHEIQKKLSHRIKRRA